MTTSAGGDEDDGSDAMGAADERALLRAVERFALLLTEAGMPRMAARVFAYLVMGEADEKTAGELSTELRVSPAAISGAVRYLVQAGLLEREREPGARSDHYRLHGDLWYETYLQRLDQLGRWEAVLAETIDLVGPERAGQSLRETRAFIAFLREQMPAMLERWRVHKAKLLAVDDDGV